MSVKSRCNICFKESKISMNFGYNEEAENEFHAMKWCKCPYETSEEMMLDQDLGVTDPSWLLIAKNLLEEYHELGRTVKTQEQDVRLFLKLLNYHTKNYRKTMELKDYDRGIKSNERVSNGNPVNPTKFNVFE